MNSQFVTYIFTPLARLVFARHSEAGFGANGRCHEACKAHQSTQHAPSHRFPPLVRPQTTRPISGQPCTHSIATCDELHQSPHLRIAYHAFSTRPWLADRGRGVPYARARGRGCRLQAAAPRRTQVPLAPQLRQRRPRRPAAPRGRVGVSGQVAQATALGEAEATAARVMRQRR